MSPEFPPAIAASPLPLVAQAGFGLITLQGASPLRIQLLPTGAVYSIRHGNTLINQVLPGPAGEGLFRMYVREHDSASPSRIASTRLLGAGIPLTHGTDFATWTVTAGAPAAASKALLECTTTLQVHPREAAWRWRVQLRNVGEEVRRVDVVQAQDLGLGDEGAVRNNEAYTSHYVDFLPVLEPSWGWTLRVRQNQPMQGGRHPWLALACVSGAEAFCTDGSQFFGSDHRFTGRAAATRIDRLASRRLQYECALAGLQSRVVELAPGAVTEVVFVARFLEDHPDASVPADAEVLRDLISGFPSPGRSIGQVAVPATRFASSEVSHGDDASAADLASWFPGAHRHVERSDDGEILSFFCDEHTHVVTGGKETRVVRPHGHVLRSGDASWIDDAQFGVTVYAAGIFGAQSYLGNPSLARLLPVVRDALGVIRSSGQRIFMRSADGWIQLGIPSAFALEPGRARWIYHFGSDVIDIRVWCARETPASFLEVRVVAGEPREFLITHELALGANEFDQGGHAEVFSEAGWVRCLLEANTFTARHLPGTCFALAALGPDPVVIGGDEMLYLDGQRRGGPYVVFQVAATTRTGIAQLGSTLGAAALPGLVGAARAAFAAPDVVGEPLPLALQVSGGGEAVARLNEILPWFNHNAAIHFSAPHGLEQYGGAAWGVRDVCQGSLEWLLAAGRFDVVRRMLTMVFSQQYFEAERDRSSLTGTWPQWFMFPPFHAIQQAHSHGDVCFWPVKALCDYIEASGDLAFANTFVGYTNPRTFTPAGPLETLWVHCDRVLAHVESRFIHGTALVNYGDGDWDDTLQPADPTMRTRMISAWTVGLAYHTLRQLGEVCRRASDAPRAARLRSLLTRIRADFVGRLMPNGVVAGFAITEPDGVLRPLLHPEDRVTGIRYRLLPMTRSILAELFTPDEARRHLDLIETELRYPDGVRLMSEPAPYHGGTEHLFRRAETAANVGREIGLQYVHAHLRYAEALAKVGDAERLWTALQVVNPVGLAAAVPNAALRQSNVYFSSSDADFPDRYEANARWGELRRGTVAVRGGWRLYSSGPGLFVHKVRTCLLGVRESYGDVIFDPVLPRSLDGLRATLEVVGIVATVTYRVKQTQGPTRLVVNGQTVNATREANPYRVGGLKISASQLKAMLNEPENQIEVEV